MDGSRPCQNCGKRTLVQDEVTGDLVCSSCSLVQEFNNFQAHIGGLTGPTGTSVRIGTAGSGSLYSYKDTKIYQAQKLIEEITFKLGLSPSRSTEVKFMVDTITEGEYGQGTWLPVFIGACAYVAMRKDNKTLPIVEIVAVIGCDIYELGRMVNRVVDFLDLKLPEFDIVDSFERAIKSSPSFSSVSTDQVDRMLKQGVFLVQCMVKWFLTTGRRPLPVVAAVLVFIAELNQVDVKIEDVARELHVAVTTCRRRYKELLERLLRVARVLPWGKDVKVKNIMQYAPLVIQYMEMKSMTKHGKARNSLEHVGFDLDDVMGDSLSKEIGYGFDSYVTENESLYFESEHSPSWSLDDLEKLKVSHECLSEIYSKFLEDISHAHVKSTKQSRNNNKRKRMGGFGLRGYTDWWKGKSKMCKKLFLDQILEKDVGLNPMPPSFDRGCLAYQRRREKIKAAKLRIANIVHPSNAESSDKEVCFSECENVSKKQRRMQVDIDWEDFVIETLLLHQVKEEEIEKGNYNTLLDLHVFNSGIF